MPKPFPDSNALVCVSDVIELAVWRHNEPHIKKKCRGIQLVTLITEVLFFGAFITGNSSLEPLLEGLFAQIHIDLK